VSAPSEPPGRLAGAAHVLKSLSPANLLSLFLILCMAAPAYLLYRAINDPALLDRFLSSYRVIPSDTACTIRAAAERGASEQWSISTGFAFAGDEQYNVGVILDHEPVDQDEISAHCATLLLIVEKMHGP
jgi:hypothetical protein